MLSQHETNIKIISELFYIIFFMERFQNLVYVLWFEHISIWVLDFLLFFSFWVLDFHQKYLTYIFNDF